MPMLPLILNEDTLPVLLAVQMKTPLMGDAQLHLLAGMPVHPNHLISIATITTNATTQGFVSGDITKVTNELTKRKATKA